MRMFWLAAIAAAMVGGSSQAATVGEKFGVWTVTEMRDSMTDAVTFSATAASGDNDAVVWSCTTENGPNYRDLSFVHRPYLGRGRRAFTYRLDDAPAETVLAGYREQSVIVNDPNDAQPFESGLKTAKRLRLRLTDGAFSKIDVDFDLTGQAQALSRLDALCATLKN